jgi:hypothetical protein
MNTLDTLLSPEDSLAGFLTIKPRQASNAALEGRIAYYWGPTTDYTLGYTLPSILIILV